MYSSTLSLTSPLDGFGWSTPCPGSFTPGKETRYPFYKSLGGPQDRSGRVRKFSPHPLEFDLRSKSLFRLHHAGPQPKSE